MLLTGKKMDAEFVSLADGILGGYAKQAAEANVSRDQMIMELLRHRKLPKEGWDELTIDALIQRLAAMDSNNFPAQVGAGEREGRILCPLVQRRHFRLSHGVGRSGDVAEVQPKAAGSSLANRLACSLVLDAIRLAGVRSCQSALIVPIATGMSLMLCMLSWKQKKPDAKYVIWSRIDQKSCLKSIITAGLTPIVIDLIPNDKNDELTTNLTGIREALLKYGAQVLCVMTTTSCFAPRVSDDIEKVAELCKEFDVAHLVNNAYGLQSSKCCHLIEQASKVGRVDAFVQSADKNFQVPVGGAIIAGFDKDAIHSIGKSYPGRGSATPAIDLLMTLLWQGARRWQQALTDRKQTFHHLRDSLEKIAAEINERLLNTPSNQISLALSLSTFDRLNERKFLTGIGAHLFAHCCTGARVVPKDELKKVEGIDFVGWGSHSSDSKFSYLNVACAIGMTTAEVDIFIERLRKTFLHARKQTGCAD